MDSFKHYLRSREYHATKSKWRDTRLRQAMQRSYEFEYQICGEFLKLDVKERGDEIVQRYDKRLCVFYQPYLEKWVLCRRIGPNGQLALQGELAAPPGEWLIHKLPEWDDWGRVNREDVQGAIMKEWDREYQEKEAAKHKDRVAENAEYAKEIWQLGHERKVIPATSLEGIIK